MTEVGPAFGEQSRTVIGIDPDIADLVGPYLARRAADVESIRALLTDGEFATVERIAHRIKGSAGSYGFARLSVHAAALESAAAAADAGRCSELAAVIAAHLDSIEMRIEGR